MYTLYTLRGHHLLCLLGYRGMGYSQEYIANMTLLHQTLRTEPHTEIMIVGSPDDLCKKFPSSSANSLPYHCEDAHIHQRDAATLAQLGLEVGQKITWSEIESRIVKRVEATDIQHLCSTCSWRSYGVCEEGITDLKAGKRLRQISS